MKQKELAKAIKMISKWKNPLVSMVNTKIFQRCKGYKGRFPDIYTRLVVTFVIINVKKMKFK